MEGIDVLLNYLSRSSFITFFVLGWLSIYIIITFGVLFSRYIYLSSWLSREKSSLESMLMGAKIVRDDSILKKCSNSFGSSEKMLNVCKNVAEKNASEGLWVLSMIASTSPFIGLFGTVVSILETFSALGSGNGGASLSIIAPAISEALIATAAGIFVAIPAYSAHLFIKRKAYEVISYIHREAELLLSISTQKENNDV
jgi:biopolymer transport protein ExbB/TolQ